MADGGVTELGDAPDRPRSHFFFSAEPLTDSFQRARKERVERDSHGVDISGGK